MKRNRRGHTCNVSSMAQERTFIHHKAGDKSEPTSVTGVSNDTVLQEGAQDTLRQNCLSVSQNQSAKLRFDISQAGGKQIAKISAKISAG